MVVYKLDRKRLLVTSKAYYDTKFLGNLMVVDQQLSIVVKIQSETSMTIRVLSKHFVLAFITVIFYRGIFDFRSTWSYMRELWKEKQDANRCRSAKKGRYTL